MKKLVLIFALMFILILSVKADTELFDNLNGTNYNATFDNYCNATSCHQISEFLEVSAGDITAVNTDGRYLTGGATSGDANLLLDGTELNKSINSSIDFRVGAGDGNFTVTLGKIFLNFLDLAQLNNANSAFITIAVSSLTNYFTKTQTTAMIDGNTSALRNNIDTNITLINGIFPNLAIFNQTQASNTNDSVKSELRNNIDTNITLINTIFANLDIFNQSQASNTNDSVKSELRGDIDNNITALNESVKLWVYNGTLYIGSLIDAYIVDNVTGANISMKAYVDVNFPTAVEITNRDHYNGSQVNDSISIHNSSRSDDDILSVINGSDVNASGMTLARIGDSTYSTVQDLQNIYHSVGWVTGGNITGNDTHINISSGTGLIRAVDNRTQTVFYFDWSGTTDTLIPVNTTRYLGIEYNAGSPQVVIKSLDTWDYQTEFPIGTVIQEDTGMHILINPQAIGDHASFMVIRSYETMPFARDARNGGLILGTKGKNVTMTAGTVWDRLNDFPLTAKDTSGSDTMDRYYRNSGSGFIIEQGVTEWNNSKYDDGSGSLASLGNNKFGVQWFYIEVDDELVSLYGTATYNSLGAAEEEGVPTSVPDRLSKHGKLIGRIIFKEGDTTASSIESLFPPSFAGATVTDHGDLAGLADDDHIQYLLTTGGRALTADWAAGSFYLTATGFNATDWRNASGAINILSPHANRTDKDIEGTVNISGNFYNLSIPCSLINDDGGGGDGDFCTDNVGSGADYTIIQNYTLSSVGCPSGEVVVARWQNGTFNCTTDATSAVNVVDLDIFNISMWLNGTTIFSHNTTWILENQYPPTNKTDKDIQDTINVSLSQYNINVTLCNTTLNTLCSGTTTYLDGTGACDDISGVYVQASDWTTHDNYATGCTNQFVVDIDDTLTCASVDSADIGTVVLSDLGNDINAITNKSDAFLGILNVSIVLRISNTTNGNFTNIWNNGSGVCISSC